MYIDFLLKRKSPRLEKHEPTPASTDRRIARLERRRSARLETRRIARLERRRSVRLETRRIARLERRRSARLETRRIAGLETRLRAGLETRLRGDRRRGNNQNYTGPSRRETIDRRD
jgi:hypothetical protein